LLFEEALEISVLSRVDVIVSDIPALRAAASCSYERPAADGGSERYLVDL
jgi:hypothetical protein